MAVLKNKVRLYRFRSNEMTQQQLADLVSVSRQTVHAIEKGKFNPSIKLALLIAGIFKVAVDELFWLEDDVSSAEDLN
ncbi:MAG: helix-turn-helix transcriptional regulator [Candidatus Cloacimonetes bacterium]|nr:helix-turn-helix transcriptional regulator [Candidatus Cloacimonadota bacterium]